MNKIKRLLADQDNIKVQEIIGLALEAYEEKLRSEIDDAEINSKDTVSDLKKDLRELMDLL